jgi:macrolide-specific efflux system membrane fusion protein
MGLGAAAIAVAYSRTSSVGRTQEGEPRIATVRAAREVLTVSAVALGTVKPQVGAEVKVGSRLSGVVAELAVGIGDVVQQGDLLALLDDREWRARVAALEAELAEMMARHDYARAQLAAVAAAGVAAPLERANTRKELAVLEAAADRVRARLGEAQIQLGYARITAPVAGTIASVSTYEGETVAASFAAPTFVTIVDLARLEIHAFVDETDIGLVREGQPVTFRVDAYAGRELRGAVSTIRPMAELVNNVVNYVAIVDIDDAGTGVVLRPEMTAHVSFELARNANALAVPRSAVLREGGTTYVFVRDERAFRKTPVETGLTTPQRIEITAGLADGAVLVTDAPRWQEQQSEESE